MSCENLKNLPANQFRRVCGVKPETFDAMVDALATTEQRKRKPGRPPKLSLADQVLLALKYHYDYRTQLQLGVETGLGESAVCRLIQRVEERLLADEGFHPPKRRERVPYSREEVPAVTVDATEIPIERPKKLANDYSGKKKRHTLKAQPSIDLSAEMILATAVAPGRVHDLKRFEAHCREMSPVIPGVFDKGYQGIQPHRLHVFLPYKVRRGQPLDQEQRAYNRLHAAVRIRVEHMIRSLKRFRILGVPYRNRQRRFGLRLNLIAVIHNLEIAATA